MAILAIVTGGWFIRSTLNFPASLERKEGVEKPFTGDIPVDRIEKATARAAGDAQAWNAPIRSNKPVPLFKSVLLLLKYSEPDTTIDMFTENAADPAADDQQVAAREQLAENRRHRRLPDPQRGRN